MGCPAWGPVAWDRSGPGQPLLAVYAQRARGLWPGAGEAWVPPPGVAGPGLPNAHWECTYCAACQQHTLTLRAERALGRGDE
eukprot:15466768-Alexandrium_andersonii.AAC.1